MENVFSLYGGWRPAVAKGVVAHRWSHRFTAVRPESLRCNCDIATEKRSRGPMAHGPWDPSGGPMAHWVRGEGPRFPHMGPPGTHLWPIMPESSLAS